MVTFVATLNVAVDREPDFERLQTELSELSHANEPGLIAYDVIRHAEKPRTYVVYARFENSDAFDFHQTAAYHERLVPPILDCVEGEMDLQFFEWVS